MNTELFELKPCPQCKGTGDAHHQGHDYDCGDCLGTGYEEPQGRIINLELMLNEHKMALKSSDAHNNDLAQKLEIAWEQRDELLRYNEAFRKETLICADCDAIRKEEYDQAIEQRDRLAEALWNMLNQEHGSAVKAGILLRSLNLQYLNPNTPNQERKSPASECSEI
jgi:hypothetical protein